MLCLNLFFFFQAEDGIRDLYVTGVQTCALPISPGTCGPVDLRHTAASVLSGAGLSRDQFRRIQHHHARHHEPAHDAESARHHAVAEIGRASCRKECRTRWSAYHEQKKAISDAQL